MDYMVDTVLEEVNFAPDPVNEVLQNVKYILITTKWSIPLDRMFGLSGQFVDMPVLAARARYTSEIIDEVHRREPRATVTEVISAERNAGELSNGRLNAVIKVRVDV